MAAEKSDREVYVSCLGIIVFPFFFGALMWVGWNFAIAEAFDVRAFGYWTCCAFGVCVWLIARVIHLAVRGK